MNSQIQISSLLIIAILLFQPTHQYRLGKRELTEYDLTHFIVGTCSSDQNDLIIQNLCDQTLQSALLGNFPFLIYYCQTFGARTNYCHNLNQQAILQQSNEAKRLAYRRLVRSLHGDNSLHRNKQIINNQVDSNEKLILSKCILPSEQISIDNDQFCNKTLQEIEQGEYPIIRHICMYYPSTNNYCQLVRYYSTLYSHPSAKSSSSLSSLTHSPMKSNNPSFVSSSSSSTPVKKIDIDSTVDQ